MNSSKLPTKKEQTFLLLRYLRHKKGDLWFDALISRVEDELTLEDDKLRAFHALPQGVMGLWVAAL
jgi:hypothetical protein